MAGARVAQCAIGRNDNAAVETAAALVPDSPAEPQRASCRLVGTAAHAPAATGWMKFEMTPAGNMAITYEVSDISSTQPNFGHPIHVHQRGNVADTVTAMQVQGHFNGSCSSCRPVGILQEVGNIGDGYRINVASGATRTAGQLVDSVMALSGPRSIIGRSVVVHGKTGDPDVPRAAQCVIGIDAPAPAPAAPSFFSSLTWGSILLILVGIAVIFGGIVYAYRRWKHNYASFDSDTEAMARS
jgi:Cu/Zn superoxide dismutase